MTTVAFTGHRPEKIGGYDMQNSIAIAVKDAIRKELMAIDPDDAISGMALGVDQIAALVCIGLKIPFTAAIPFLGQESVWNQESQRYYDWLISKAETVKICSPGTYSARKMQIRNEWMVDCCDILIAVYDGTSGGTRNCVEYAKDMKKDIHIINPKDFIPPPKVYQREGYL